VSGLALKSFALLMAATPALAHAKLTTSDPAADAKVKTPRMIRLTFSEKLEPAFSGASLIDAAGKTVPLASSVAGSGITLLPLPLKPGRYRVAWHSVGQDTHRMKGSFSFEIVP
jgi:methionine-rich copper-binding protein CopC